MVNANRKKIKDALSETFPYCFTHPLIDNKEYLVDVKDGVKLKVKTTIKDDGSVLITPT